MGKSEEWFWDSELRIVWNLIHEKKEIEKVKAKNLAIYIASYVWGKDPVEEEETEIAGRDKPVDEKLLRGFF
jgi:hypothetical protein